MLIYIQQSVILISNILTDPTSNCRTISPIPAPVTNTVVAQPGIKKLASVLIMQMI